MMPKIIGGILVIIASSLIGFKLASRFSKRVQTLEGFISAMKILDTEISYSQSPVREAFISISKAVETPVGTVFLESAEMLSSEEYSMNKCFRCSIEKYKGDLCLDNVDIDILFKFSLSLGKSDRLNQQKNIAFTLQMLGERLEDSKVKCSKNKKMYQSFGVLGGVLVTILFL